MNNDTMNNGITYTKTKHSSFFIDKLKKHTEVGEDFDVVRLLCGDMDNPEVLYLVDEIKKKSIVFSEYDEHNKTIDMAKTKLAFKAEDLLTNFVMDGIFNNPSTVTYSFGSSFGDIELGYRSSEFGDLYIGLRVYDDSAAVVSCTINFNGNKFRLVEEDVSEDPAYVLIYKPACAGDNTLSDWKSDRFEHVAFKHMCEHLIPRIAMEIYKASKLGHGARLLEESCTNY